MPRPKFILISAVVVLAAVAITILMAGLVTSTAAAETADGLDPSSAAPTPDGIPIRPLSLELSLTVVVDMSLMTLGLVILFMDDGATRYRAR